MDYDSIESHPDRDGWVLFLQDRICFSFKTIEELDKDTKKKLSISVPTRKELKSKWYALSEPTLDIKLDDPSPFSESLNFWMRSLSFYAAGKILDVHELKWIMSRFQFAHMDSIAQIIARHAFGIQDAWNSAQVKRMYRLLNTNKLDAERAMTTHLMQALEFSIKAVLVHCNYYRTKTFFFREGHDLVGLYEAIPDCCRDELERAANDFFDDFEADRMRTEVAARELLMNRNVRSVESSARTVNEFDNLMADRKYLDKWNEDVPHRPPKLKDWVHNSLRAAGNLMDHRYGPTPRDVGRPTSAVDPYSTHAIAAALFVARFFLEYLFGWETVAKRHKTLRGMDGAS